MFAYSDREGSRRPGVFVLSGEDDLRVFDQASGIEYEAESGVVIIQTVVYVEKEGNKAELTFKPAAWLKLEKGMLVGLGHAPRRQEEPSAAQPYVVRGKDRFEFRNAGNISRDRDVITFRHQLRRQVADYPGWPQDQILYLLRLGPGVILVDSNSDRPMEIALERQATAVHP
jgi:hypothetical protein